MFAADQTKRLKGNRPMSVKTVLKHIAYIPIYIVATPFLLVNAILWGRKKGRR